MAAVTIKQIAELAGVSIGTVDRALHGRSGVNAEVARRVLEIADRLGYRPNIMAKALAIKRDPVTIGVVFHVHSNPFFSSVVSGVKEAAEKYKDFGISVRIAYGQDFDPEDQLRLIDDLISENVSALVVVPLNDQCVMKRLNDLHESGFPVVLLVSNLKSVECLAFVGCDTYQVGRVAGGITGLICSGTGNVLYASSPLQILGNQQRLQGFQNTLQMRYPSMNLVDVCEFENDEILAYKRATDVFSSNSAIDAIMIATGSLRGIFQALNESPFAERTKIVALDLSEQVVEGISNNQVVASVIQHPHKQGGRAIQVLADYFVYNTKPEQTINYIESDIKIYEDLF